jgi:hypothetical protein
MSLAVLVLSLFSICQAWGQLNQARRDYPERFVPAIESRILPPLYPIDDEIIFRNVIARQWQTIAAQDARIRDLSQSFNNLAKSTKKIVIFKNPIADALAKVAIAGVLTWTVNQIKD